MDIAEILGKGGRMELADLASLLLPVSVARKEIDVPDGEEFEEDCEGCEEDEDECVLCSLRSILHQTDQSRKAAQGRSGKQVFPFRFWAKFTTSRGMVEQ